MEIILWICLCTIACIGVAVMAGDYFFVRRCEAHCPGSYQLFALYNNPAQVEAVLSCCLAKATWVGCRHPILLVDMGMGPECKALCRRLTGGLHNVCLCKEAQVGHFLRRQAGRCDCE